jgi:hypothetical protein
MQAIARLALNDLEVGLVRGRRLLFAITFSLTPFSLKLKGLGHLKKRSILVSDESTR